MNSPYLLKWEVLLVASALEYIRSGSRFLAWRLVLEEAHA